jgi:hypothetical protein
MGQSGMSQVDKEAAWGIVGGVLLLGVAGYAFSKGWWLPGIIVVFFGGGFTVAGLWHFLK